MTRKRVSIQFIHVGRQFCPQRIQVTVANHLQEGAGFLAQNQFAVVLEKVTVSPMTPVVPDGMARQQSAQHRGNGNRAGSQQKMKMVGHQGRGKTRSFCLLQDRTQMVQEIMAVRAILENLTPLNASRNRVLQHSLHGNP